MRAPFATALLAAATVVVAACGSAPAASTASTPTAPATSAAPTAPAASAAPAMAGSSGATATVMEVNAPGMGGAFSPASISIHPGDSVTFTNASGNIHNVTFADMHSPIMYGGERWSATFPKPGTYKYVCTYHPGMEGVVNVG